MQIPDYTPIIEASNTVLDYNNLFPVKVATVYDPKPSLRQQRIVAPFIEQMSKTNKMLRRIGDTFYTAGMPPEKIDTGQRMIARVVDIENGGIRIGNVRSGTMQELTPNSLEWDIDVYTDAFVTKTRTYLLEDYLQNVSLSNISYDDMSKMSMLLAKQQLGIKQDESLALRWYDTLILNDLAGINEYDVTYAIDKSKAKKKFGFSPDLTFPTVPTVSSLNKIYQILIHNYVIPVGSHLYIWACKEFTNMIYDELTKNPNSVSTNAAVSNQFRYDNPKQFQQLLPYPIGEGEEAYVNVIPVSEFITLIPLMGERSIKGISDNNKFRIMIASELAYCGYERFLHPIEVQMIKNQPLSIKNFTKTGGYTMYGNYFVAENVIGNGQFYLDKLNMFGCGSNLKIPARFECGGSLEMDLKNPVTGDDYTDTIASIKAEYQSLYDKELGDLIEILDPTQSTMHKKLKLKM